MRQSSTSHSKKKAGRKNTSAPELSLVRVLEIDIDEIMPSPENDTLYRPVDPKDPTIVELSKSIKQHGILEPLVLTSDMWIVSGHRRYAAAQGTRLTTLPCKVLPIRRSDDKDAFVRLLREHNRQREKSLDERLREEVVSIDPAEAHCALSAYRTAQATVNVDKLAITGTKHRCEIGPAKKPFARCHRANNKLASTILAAVGSSDSLRVAEQAPA